MAEYNVIDLDSDERNARPMVVDGRRPSMIGPRRPGAGIVVPPSTRPTIIQGGGLAPSRHYPVPTYPTQPTVVYHQPAQASGLGLAGMSNAELIELAALALTALQPLPGAPTAQGDVETDVENLVIYQTALAGHAKQVDRIRVLAEVIGKVMRR
ncbi:MAG: hypothetical protein F9K40_05925 [Kofleriaceae bacterium]|nr:MAG: hypothetical protein F9K40_05925 [Kofleriaceae bacterium]MBZ0236513.1 hypothetical protein [Kofleriaceae bacterium]